MTEHYLGAIGRRAPGQETPVDVRCQSQVLVVRFSSSFSFAEGPLNRSVTNRATSIARLRSRSICSR